MIVIPTRHQGIDYRSMTEAEWADALTSHGIGFEYERTVFFFGLVAPVAWVHVNAYRPDFWLPKLRLWLEIKAEVPTKIEFRKAALLAECSGTRVLMTTGRPAYSDHAIFVQGINTSEVVSTFGGGPLTLKASHLNVAPDVRPGLRRLGSVGTPVEMIGPKLVLYLRPEHDHRTSCFCGREPFRDCWRCSAFTRTYVTDECARRLDEATMKSVRHEARGIPRQMLPHALPALGIIPEEQMAEALQALGIDLPAPPPMRRIAVD